MIPHQPISTLFPYTTLFRSIGYIDNSNISNSSIPRIDRICNSLIANSTLGSASFQMQLMSNNTIRSEEHTSELQSLTNLVCRLLLEKKKKKTKDTNTKTKKT